MAYTPETTDEGGYGSTQAYNQSMEDFRGAMGKYRQYEDKMRRRIEARQDAQWAMQERERKRKASVWSNLGLVGTIVGSAFGGVGAAIGGALGSVAGMGIAAARGGDPFDMGAQFEYMDMGLLGSAASGVAGSMASQKAQNEANRMAWAERKAYLTETGQIDPRITPRSTSIKLGAPSVQLPSDFGAYPRGDMRGGGIDPSPGQGPVSQRMRRRIQ